MDQWLETSDCYRFQIFPRANFCVRTSCFSIDMKASRGDDCIKGVKCRLVVDVVLLLHLSHVLRFCPKLYYPALRSFS